MNNHIDTELLLNYVEGSVEPALSLAIALHQKHCPTCRQKIKDLESHYGENLELSESTHNEGAGFDRLITDIAKLTTADTNKAVPQVSTNHDRENNGDISFVDDYAVAEINRPLLKQLLNFNQDDFEWQKLSSKISTVGLELYDASFKVNLLRFSAKTKIPKHTHLGKEFTFVIEGDFKDHKGTHTAGDFIACDGSDEHSPVAGDTGCVCLAITEAPIKFTGILGPLLNRYASY